MRKRPDRNQSSQSIDVEWVQRDNSDVLISVSVDDETADLVEGTATIRNVSASQLLSDILDSYGPTMVFVLFCALCKKRNGGNSPCGNCRLQLEQSDEERARIFGARPNGPDLLPPSCES